MVDLVDPAEDPILAPATGNRTIQGSSLSDVMAGSSSNDVILSGDGADLILAGGGNDHIDGGGGQDFLIAGDGNDTVVGGLGDDSIAGGAGGDLMLGGADNDTVIGGAGNDTLYGGTGDDTVSGGDGADTLIAGSGSDSIDGGADNDLFILDPVLQAGSLDVIEGGAGLDQARIMFFDLDVFEAFNNDVTSLGMNTALLNAGFQVTGVESFIMVPVGLGPLVGPVLDVTAAEDDPALAVDLTDGTLDTSGTGLSIQNFQQLSGNAIDFQLTGASFQVDPLQFNFLVLGDTEAFSFSYEIVDGEGVAATQFLDFSVTGANSPVVIDFGNSFLDVDVPISLGGVSGFLSFEEFAVGTLGPVGDGFVTVDSVSGNQAVRAQGFTQIPGVFEGQYFGFASTPFTIEFEAPVNFVSFGLFDPNLVGGLVTAFDDDGGIIEQLTFGDEIPVGPAGGSTSALVTFDQPGISQIVIEPLAGDIVGIDELSYSGDGGTLTGEVSGTALIAFDDPDRIDTQTARIVDAAFVGDTGLLPAGLEAEDFLTLFVQEPGVTSSGQVSVDFIADADLFEDLGDGDSLSLVAEIEISDDAGLTDTATVTFNFAGGNQTPVLIAEASTLTATVTVDQIDPGAPSGVIDFEQTSIGDTGAVTDGFATVSAADEGVIVETSGPFPSPLVNEGLLFSSATQPISISFDAPVDSVGLGVVGALGSDVVISIFDGSDTLLEQIELNDLDFSSLLNGVGAARAYFSRSEPEIARVEVTATSGGDIAVDEIRYGFGPRLTPTTFATFQDIDGIEFEDSFITFRGDFQGDPDGNIPFDPIDYLVEDFFFIGELQNNLATRESALAIENNLFAFLREGETVTATLQTQYADHLDATADAVFEYTFVGVNDAPLAANDFAFTDEDTSVTIELLANDFDVDGASLTLTQINGANVQGGTVTLPSGATLAIGDDGEVDYDPTGSTLFNDLATGEVLVDTFTYTIEDDSGAIGTGTVSVEVAGIDDINLLPLNLTDQFDPSNSGSLYGMSVSPNGAEIAVITQSGSTVDFYSPQGALLRTIPLPGDNGNDGDLDFAAVSFSLNGVTIPAGTLLVMSGDSGAAEVFAVDPADGSILTTLSTVVGNSFTVGVAHNPVTETLFLLTCNCDSDGNVIVEVDPDTGAELSRIDLDPLDFQTFFGDVDVDPVTGDLFLVSSSAEEVLRLAPDGEVVDRYELPAGVSGLSGVSVGLGDPAEIYVSSTNGTVTLLTEGQAPVNRAPVANGDTATTDADTPVVIDVAANDIDPNGDLLTFDLIPSTGDGSADAILDFTFTGNGTAPDPEIILDGNLSDFLSLPTGTSVTVGFLDEIVFDRPGDDFEILEEINSEVALVEISSDGVNFVDVGTIAGDTAFDLADFGFTDRLLAVRVTGLDNGGTSPGFDLVTVRALGDFSGGTLGEVVETSEGVFEYDPNGQFDGLISGESATDFFTYQVTDPLGETAFASVAVTVEGVGQNAPPIVSPLQFQASEDDPLTLFDLIPAPEVTDPNGDALTVSNLSVVDDGGGAVLSLSGTELSADFAALGFLALGASVDVVVTYDISDGINAPVSNTATISVAGANDAVVAGDDDGSGSGAGFVVRSASYAEGYSYTVAALGDINGDGIDDFVIGAQNVDRGQAYYTNEGAAFVVFGSRDPEDLVAEELDGGDGFIIIGASPYNYVGSSVADAGDFNGDGIADILVGARGYDYGNSAGAGATYVIFGKDGGFGPALDLGALDPSDGMLITVSEGDAGLGFTVAKAGDLNDDGFDDILLGAPYSQDDSHTWVVFGTDTGLPETFDLSLLTANEGALIPDFGSVDFFNQDFAALGDVNGDDIDDIAIAVKGGSARLIFGADTGVGGVFVPDAYNTTLISSSGFYGTGFGYSIAGGGDINGDGINDIVIGSNFADIGGGSSDYTGAVFVIFGQSGGFDETLDPATLDGTNGFRIDGEVVGSRFGEDVSFIGDVNGDGIDDLMVGAIYGGTDAGNYNATGEAFILFGRDTTSGASFDAVAGMETLDASEALRLIGAEPASATGVSISGGKDLNGDGVSDLIIAAPGTGETTISGVGEAFVVFGGDELAGLDADGDGFIDLGDLLDGIGGGFLTTENTVLDIAASQLLANDVDPDGDALSIVEDVVVLASGAIVTTGASTVSYDPNGAFNGLDAGEFAQDTFTYEVTDGNGGSDTATVTVTIEGVGSAITLGLDNFATSDGAPIVFDFADLLLNDSDSDGDTLSIALVDAASAFGAPVSVSSTTVTYDPASFYEFIAAGQSLVDTFSYEATDGNGSFATGTVLVTLTGTNDPVIAVNDVPTPGTGFTINGIQAGDISGWSVSSAGDVNDDGIDDILIGAAFASRDSGSFVGESYVVFGSGERFEGNIELEDLDGTNGFRLTGRSAFDNFGYAVSDAGDLNGDGIGDIAISAPFRTANGEASAGETFVIFGSSAGFGASVSLASLDGSNGFVIQGESAEDSIGLSLSGAGDINGDGIDDLLIGAPSSNGSGTGYVVFGSNTGFAAALQLSALNGANGFAIPGLAVFDRTGDSVSAAGDFNGDGIDDLIIGSSGVTVGGNAYAGAVQIIFGSDSGFGASFDLASLDGTNGVTLTVDEAFSGLGLSVSDIGDFNGDGIDDVVVGAYGVQSVGNSVSGETYVVFGDAQGLPATIDLLALDGSNGFAIFGSAALDINGLAVTGVGDVNGDGLDDILIGNTLASPNGYAEAGDAHLIFGSSYGLGARFDLSSLDGKNGLIFNGTYAGDQTGRSVSGAGDINGDGVDDLLISAQYADPNGAESGKTFVVFGGVDLRIADADADGVIDLITLQPGLGPKLVTTESQPLTIAAEGLLLNDIDVDALDELTVTAVDTVSAVGATITFDGTNIVYDPGILFTSLNFEDFGADTFNYTVSDPAGTTSTAQVSILIAGEDDPPISSTSLPVVLGITGASSLGAAPVVAAPPPGGRLDVTGGSFSTFTLRMASWESDDGSAGEAIEALDLAFDLSFGGSLIFNSTYSHGSHHEAYRLTSDAGVIGVDYTLGDIQQAVIAVQMSDGSDLVIGTTADDELFGDFTGDDVLRGLSGDDLYTITMGAGTVEIDDVAKGGTDTVRLVGLDSADALVALDDTGESLVVSDGRGGEVVIRNAFNDDFIGGIEIVVFDDETFAMEDLLTQVGGAAATGADDRLIGFGGAETLSGLGGDDTISGGGGDDLLIGGDGNDTFIFGIGDGTDVIEDAGVIGSDADVLVLKGRVLADASFSTSTTDPDALQIDFANGDRAVVTSAFGKGAAVEAFEFEDQTLSIQQIEALL
ncbi:FG-GAP repeat protein [Rhodobacteraceae bacterium NNCM2]|nr:FG-GAP repeat protein [Coraliihabitans acroporae]